MYSRNTWEKRDSYSIPPGYDGSRFRRRQRRDGYGNTEDEVIVMPDSSYAPAEKSLNEDTDNRGELSVGGILTDKGLQNRRRHSAFDENPHDSNPPEEISPTNDNRESVPISTETHRTKEKLSGILDKLGFHGGMSSDDLLLCAIIFIIASDTERDGDNVGDILLILALLLGIR